MESLKSQWVDVRGKYKITQILGKGTFGTVVKAVDRKSGQLVAIKLIDDLISSSYASRKVLREVKILRKLSEIEENVFTVKLIDFILPGSAVLKNNEQEMVDLN